MPSGSRKAMPKPQPRSPYLSLVVLVRDAADDLRRLLTWHRPLVDEAVVVDTGSVDDSLAVARACGARVTGFAWRDDFSAARNHGLGLATGAWTLVLDCDELVDPKDFGRLRALCQGPDVAWFFDQWNYCGPRDDARWQAVPAGGFLAPPAAAGFVSAPTCRLFPRRSDLRYEGVVHELPEASLQRAGIPFGRAEIAIHHYGHLVAPARLKAKKAQYGRLLRAKLAQNPQDVKTRLEMAVQLVDEGCGDVAVRLLTRTVREQPQHPETHRARLLLGQLLLAAGRPSTAAAHCEDAVRRWPALREGWVAAVRLQIILGRWDQADSYLHQARRLFPADSVLAQLAEQVAASLADKREAVG